VNTEKIKLNVKEGPIPNAGGGNKEVLHGRPLGVGKPKGNVACGEGITIGGKKRTPGKGFEEGLYRL